MEQEKQLKLLRIIYAGVLADATLEFGKEGVLANVIERKRQKQLQTGKMHVTRFGVTKPEEVFTALSEVFQCANWQVEKQPTGTSGIATKCMLCNIAKKIGAPSPCELYCLLPMESMVNAINPNAEFQVKETLWDGKKCHVDIIE